MKKRAKNKITSKIRRKKGLAGKIHYFVLSFVFLVQPVANRSLNIIKKLWIDERSFKQRLLTALAPCLLFTFLLFFWGGLEPIYRNQFEVRVGFVEAMRILAVVFFVSYVLLVAFSMFLKGAYFNIFICMVFSLALGGYFQMVFMNGNVGEIDGEGFYFSYIELIFNAAVWLMALAAPLIIWLLKKQIWSKVLVYVSASLFVMQAVAFGIVLPSAISSSYEFSDTQTETWFLSTEYEFELSSNENTIVLVLDSLSNSHLTQAFNYFPHLRHELRDFTRFIDSATISDRTWPTMRYLFTRQIYDPSLTSGEWCEKIWRSPDVHDFYGALNDAGFVFNLFTSLGRAAYDGNRLNGIANNLRFGVPARLNTRMFVQEAVNLSLFRLSPTVLKQRVLATDGTFVASIDGLVHTYNDIAFYERLKNTGISTQSSHSVFALYLLNGVHRGGGGWQHINRYVEFTPGSAIVEHTAGALRIVIEYLNQMRQLGIYENANIIIMADHGFNRLPDTAFLIKRAGDSFDEMRINTAPISHEDFWPTLIDLMDLNTSRDFGRSVFDIPENEERLRVMYAMAIYAGFPNSDLSRNAWIRIPFTGPVYPHETFNSVVRVPGGIDLPSDFEARFPHIELFPSLSHYRGR